MTVAVAPRVRPCVACGDRPRYGELFVCLTCSEDRERLEQKRAAEMTTTDVRLQRRFLMDTFAWHGGWPAPWR